MKTGTVEYLDDAGNVTESGTIEIREDENGLGCEKCGVATFAIVATTSESGITEESCVYCLLRDEYIGKIVLEGKYISDDEQAAKDEEDEIECTCGGLGYMTHHSLCPVVA